MRVARSSAMAMLAITMFAVPPVLAKKKPDATWSVSRVSDPVTGQTTCVVAAFDRGAGLRFSRTGYLYPIVEMNPVHGLLVGVSSGGRFRLPTGDILWRVDDRLYEELRAADNPPATDIAYPNIPQAAADDAASRAMRDTMAQALRLSASLAATSTVASGERARVLLDQMLGGHSLLFRARAAVPDYGLPSARTHEVGQITGKGLKPFPLDGSFRNGLAECGIDMEKPASAVQGKPAPESP